MKKASIIALGAVVSMLLLCNMTIATKDARDLEKERIKVFCGNKYGSMDTPMAVFCMKYDMLAAHMSIQSLPPLTHPMTPCDACIAMCQPGTTDYTQCVQPCARACTL